MLVGKSCVEQSSIDGKARRNDAKTGPKHSYDNGKILPNEE
jgi:hypothetical protein